MPPILIVGAGLAGLSCANALHQAGRPFLLLEAADAVGGRIRTDITPDGFRLDRGFQVLLSAYPQVRRLVDLPALHASAFRSGAIIQLPDGSNIRLPDPFSEPWAIPAAIAAPIGTMADKLRIGALLLSVLRQPFETLFEGESLPTLEYLRSLGFSEQILKRFFVPFFGGVFLDRSLTQDCRFFRFVFQQFVLGRALLPAEGMQALPEQLARSLPPTNIRLGSRVVALEKNAVRLSDGSRIGGEAIVLALEGHALGKLIPGYPAPAKWARTCCTYFAAPNSPGRGDRYLRLNAKPGALAHNVCFPSDVAAGYAPAGSTLVSVSTHGDHGLKAEALTQRLKTELIEWFGSEAERWRHLRTYDIPHALPPVAGAQLHTAYEGAFVCGDHVAYPSINAALASGRSAATAVLESVC